MCCRQLRPAAGTAGVRVPQLIQEIHGLMAPGRLFQAIEARQHTSGRKLRAKRKSCHQQDEDPRFEPTATKSSQEGQRQTRAGAGTPPETGETRQKAAEQSSTIGQIREKKEEGEEEEGEEEAGTAQGYPQSRLAAHLCRIDAFSHQRAHQCTRPLRTRRMAQNQKINGHRGERTLPPPVLTQLP